MHGFFLVFLFLKRNVDPSMDSTFSEHFLNLILFQNIIAVHNAIYMISNTETMIALYIFSKFAKFVVGHFCRNNAAREISGNGPIEWKQEIWPRVYIVVIFYHPCQKTPT